MSTRATASGSAAQPACKRLFFALWPSAETRAAMHSVAAGLITCGRQVVPANLHLTLVFLGSLDVRQECLAVETGDSVRASAFGLELVRFGCFPGPRVVWSGPARAPAALAQLVQSLRRGLHERGLGVETRAFCPHVTLARKVARSFGKQPHPPVVWQAREFCLVHSTTGADGVRYEPLVRWPLGRPNSSPEP